MPYITAKEALSRAEQQLGYRPHRSAAYRWINSNKVKAARIAGQLMIEEESLRSWLSPREVTTTTPLVTRSANSNKGEEAAARLRSI